jgi:putative ABC transport system permease protein
MWDDIRLSIRGLLRQPSFSAVVILSLALGIGGATAIFSVFNAVLLRDLAYPEPEQLFMMRTVTPEGSPTGTVTPREVRPFAEDPDHSLVDAIAIAWSQETQIAADDGVAVPTRRYGVTEQFFDVFGPRMVLGRGFERGEDPGPIVISYSIWRDVFGSDLDIIGKSVLAEGFPRQVVGVTPEDFTFPEDPGFWYLMRLGPQYDRSRVYRAYVRLESGRTQDQFEAELQRLSADLGPDPATSRSMQFVAQPFLEYVVGDLRATVVILLGATGLLLLTACINVTNLMLSRATVSVREVALREALGSGRWRTLRRLLVESLTLAVIGGTFGLLLGIGGTRLLLGIAPPDLPRLDAVPIDGTVLGFALGVTVLTGLLIGLAPAWRLATNELRGLVNDGGRGAQGPGLGSRILGPLVVAEVGLAVILTIGAGLLVRTYSNLTSTDPGFDPNGALTLFMNVPGRVEVTFERMAADGQPIFSGAFYQPVADFYRDLEERIEALPGVAAATTANSIPLAPAQYDGIRLFNFPDRPGGNTTEAVQEARARSVGHDFFSVMGTSMLRGRGLLDTDRAGTPGVAVVNEAFVRRYFSGGDPLGQRIHFPEDRYTPSGPGFQLGHHTVVDMEIVGIVEDVKYSALAEPAAPTIFVSTQQWINRRRHLVVRTASIDPESLVPAIRREIESMDPALTAQYALYVPIVEASMARERLGMTLLVIFGLVALALAAVGVYGLMSYFVVQRRGEIAVRSAMGASAGQIMGLIMRRGVAYAALGVFLGLLGSSVLGRLVESQLYGVTARDLGVFVSVPLTLLCVAALACFVPSRRAARIEPAELLRVE